MTTSVDILTREAHALGCDDMLPTLTHIMMAESGGDPNCTVSTSSAKGLFQIMKDEWPDLCRRFPDIKGNDASFNIFDPAQNCRAAIHMLKEKSEALARVIGHAPSAGELYLAHFAGTWGATKILQANALNPATPMTGTLPDGKRIMSEAAIAANEAVRLKLPDGTTVHLRQMTVSQIIAWSNHLMGLPIGNPVSVSADGQATYPLNQPENDAYTPPRPGGIFEALLQFFFTLLEGLFNKKPESTATTPPPVDRSTNTWPHAPAPPAPAPAPEVDIRTLISPEVAYSLIVSNSLGLPDPDATTALLQKIFNFNGDKRAEILKFDLDGNGVLDLHDIGMMQERMRGQNLPANASPADILTAYAAQQRQPAALSMPAIDTAFSKLLGTDGLGRISALIAKGTPVDLTGPNGAPDGKFDMSDFKAIAAKVGRPQDTNFNAVLDSYAALPVRPPTAPVNAPAK